MSGLENRWNVVSEHARVLDELDALINNQGNKPENILHGLENRLNRLTEKKMAYNPKLTGV